ncbi:MAG: metallophosphoesterase family protein [Candidatus Thorarchaeota archaeon]
MSLLLIGFFMGANSPAATSIEATSNTNNSTAFNFIAYGDTRGNVFTDAYDGAVSEVHEDIVNAYLQKDPELILHTGDLAGAFRYPLQVEAFNDSLADVWDAGIPIYFTPGNHDRDKYPEVFHDEFSSYSAYLANHSQLNATLTAALDDTGETPLYYSFDYENVHFIMINNEWDWNGDDLELYEPQLDWLQADLMAYADAEFTVVAFHRPAYSVSAGRPYRWTQAASIRSVLHDSFMEYGVDLVFSGHDHFYYRTLHDGIYYVTTGGGGAPIYEIDTAAPDWQSGDVAHSENHYCNVEVTSSGASVTVLKIDGTSIDSFNLAGASEETSDGNGVPGWTTLTSIVGLIAIAVVNLHRRR